jgi:hypothetical protein
MTNPPSDKSRGVALALAFFLGWVGAHRFYVGKIGTGVLQLCTFGGLGVWWLIDLIMVGSGEFRDSEGRRLTSWDPDEARNRSLGVPQELLDEIDALRGEVTDLGERLDFAERLLADPARRTRPEEHRSDADTGMRRDT